MLDPAKSPVGNLSVLLGFITLAAVVLFNVNVCDNVSVDDDPCMPLYKTHKGSETLLLVCRVLIALTWVLGMIHVVIYPKKYIGVIGLFLGFVSFMCLFNPIIFDFICG